MATPAFVRASKAHVSRRGILVGAGGTLTAFAVGSLWHPGLTHAAAMDETDTDGVILKFGTMAGVSGAFVGAPTNPDGGTPIRGIHGGGLPWRLDEAKGELHSDGQLRVRVRGLVLAAGPKEGTNPISTFRAIVSFEGLAAVFTDPVPASTTGDADIEMVVSLPHPGFAPIIFVGPGAAPAWFAATGAM